MSRSVEQLKGLLETRFAQARMMVDGHSGQLTMEVEPDQLLETARRLRRDSDLVFAQLTDICGVDYLHYGVSEWRGTESHHTGYSRGVHYLGKDDRGEVEHRFAAVYHLLSVEHNRRLRLRVFCADDDYPVVPSVIDIWPVANWYEREAFDLIGILFEGHPDLRRILTDYGFIGHPFRKDFPLSGEVEVRYDPEKGRVVYQPVSIERRTLVPKIVREDHRYNEGLVEERPGDFSAAPTKERPHDA